MHTPLQLVPDLFQLRLSAVLATFAPDLKPAMSIFPADMREAEEVEGLRFTKSPLLTGNCRKATKPDGCVATF